MEHDEEVYYNDEHSAQESDRESNHDEHDAKESDHHASQEPEVTNEEPPPPEETAERKQGQGQSRSRSPRPTQPPRNYPAQPSPQQFPPQSPQPAYYQAAHPVQAPPQNYPPPASPHAYSKDPPTSPYSPAVGHPGVNYPNGAPVKYPNGGFAPAPGYPQQSPYQPYLKPSGTVGWSTGLFDCMDDPTNALVTACCPCFTFGQIAEIVDSGHTTCATSGILYGVIAAFTLVPCLISCAYRTKIRSQYDLVEVPAADWITHCFCEWCALCQEYRELKNRGIDPAIGWQGNMMRSHQQPQVAMMPPGNQTMQSPRAF